MRSTAMWDKRRSRARFRHLSFPSLSHRGESDTSYYVCCDDGTKRWCPEGEVPATLINAYKEKIQPKPRFFKARKGAPTEAWGGIYDVVRQIKEDEELLIKNGQGHILWS